MKFTSVGTRPGAYRRLWKSLWLSCQASVFCLTAAHLTEPPSPSTPSLVENTGGDLHVTSLLAVPSDDICHDHMVRIREETHSLTVIVSVNNSLIPALYIWDAVFLIPLHPDIGVDCREEHVLPFPALDKTELFLGRIASLTRCSTNNSIVLGTT